MTLFKLSTFTYHFYIFYYKQSWLAVNSISINQQDTRFCDVTIHTGTDEIKVHSCMLAAGSPYLSRILEACMKGNGVRLDGIDFITWMIVLDYIYTGEVCDDICADSVGLS